jgi:hypothetical protein
MAGQSNPVLEWRENYARRHLRVDFEPLAGAAILVVHHCNKLKDVFHVS